MTLDHVVFFIVPVLCMSGWLVLIAYRLGIKRGRDLQRVDDLIEQWERADKRRDPATGRFRRCSLTCTRNECADTSQTEAKP